MWIIMKEDIQAITIVFVLFSPLLALFIITAYKGYIKFRTAQLKLETEKQLEGKLDVPSGLHTPTSPGRDTLKFVLVAILVAFSGVLLGVLASIISHLMYIVFVFPLMIGVIAGGLISNAIRLTKLRKTSQLIVLSLLAAITIYGTYHYGKYVWFQTQASVEIFSRLPQATKEKNYTAATAIVDYALKEETGHSGFVGYMLYKAKEGVSVGRFYQTNRLNLGPILTWLYWLMEFGVILCVPIYMGKKSARMAFCECCGNWYGEEKHLGGTAAANESCLQDLLRKKDFMELGNLLEENAELPSLELYWQGCEVCDQSHSQLVVRRAFQGSRGLRFADASRTILQPQERVLLLGQSNPMGNQ